jgi:hypothetical protein
VLGFIGSILATITHQYGTASYLASVWILALVPFVMAAVNVTSPKVKILGTWRRLGLKTRYFPLNYEEKIAIASFLQGCILTPKAAAANKTFADRERKREIFTKLTSLTSAENMVIASDTDLEIITDWRKRVRTAKKELEVAEKLADKAHTEYLAVWDLLTHKTNDGGAELLSEKTFRDPDVFRSEVNAKTL